jgi:glycosyltransferase involved in cell wall biosynthesis
MKNGPLVSIVVPTFNREHCIENAIKSIVTNLPHEILVIDDGSRDRTEQVVSVLALQNLHFIKHKVNQGAAAARNTGIKLAKGKYIAFLDSDDTWLPYKLDKQVEFLARHSEVRVCYTSFFYKKKSGKQAIRCPLQDNYTSFLSGCFIGPGTTLLLEKEIFNEIGYYATDLKRFEDWDLLLRLCRRFPLKRLNLPLAIVNQSSAPVSQDVIESADLLRAKLQQDVENVAGKRGLKIFLNALGSEKFINLVKNKHYINSLRYFKNFIYSFFNRHISV